MSNTQKQEYTLLTKNANANALASYNTVVSKFDAVSHGISRGSLRDIKPDVTIRSPFNKDDYDFWRPSEKVPENFKDIIYACRSIYTKIGIVRNVIDMMTDFAIEDLSIVHQDKKHEAFIKAWMKKVKIHEAVEEFARHLLIDYNVVVKRTKAKISKPVENQWMSRAKEDVQKLYTDNQTNKKEIPWRYTFLNVAALTWSDDEEDKLTGKKKLKFKLSNKLLNKIKSPNFSNDLLQKMPDIVKKSISNGQNEVELDMDQVYVAHNKKDSWQDWSIPYLYALLPDVIFREKLRQAENAALDGVINVVRLWKLGDHTNGILPNQAVINKLIEILEVNTGGGTVDIVWDSMIDMKEYYPPVAEILGSEKYDQVNRDILIGLGVPEVLIGGRGGNFSNSYIQLKTMVEKLKSIRSKIIDWLQTELSILCEAMDIPTSPKIRFNQMTLEDENATRKLILGLLDRGIISVEAVLNAYGEDFLLEAERIKYEKKFLKDHDVKVKSPLDKQDKSKSVNPKGRPPSDVDITRKQREAKPKRSEASLMIFASDAIDLIDKYIVPIYLKSLGISNARQLTTEQREEVDTLRLDILSKLNPDDSLDEESIIDISLRESKPNKLYYLTKKDIEEYVKDSGNYPTLAQRKKIEAVNWAKLYKGD